MLLRCLEKEDSEQLLEELHQGQARGHFEGDTTVHKVLRDGYYWPTLFKDSHAIARKCVKCQKCAGRFKRATLPLQPVLVEQPFQQWGLDMVGPITPSSSAQHKYILTARTISLDRPKLFPSGSLILIRWYLSSIQTSFPDSVCLKY